MAAGTETRQLLLQVDASVALAQRNLGTLAADVDRNMATMDGSIGKIDPALQKLGRSLQTVEQIVVATSNQTLAFGTVVDQLTARELAAANAIGAFAQATRGKSAAVQVATRDQLAAAAAIGSLARATANLAAVQGRQAAAGGRSNQIAVQAGQQFQDFFIQIQNGQSILVAGTQQVSQLAIVMQGAEGRAGQFASFMNGPWGIAVIGAASILGMLINAFWDTDEASKKTAITVDEYTSSQDLAKLSAQQLSDAIRDQQRALQQQVESTREAENASVALQQRLVQETIRRREATVAALEQARADLQVADIAAMGAPDAGTGYQSRFGNRVTQLESALAQANRDLATAREGLGTARQVEIRRGVRERTDPEARISRDFDDSVNAARSRYGFAISQAAGNARKVADAEARLARELEAAEVAQRTAREALQRSTRRPRRDPDAQQVGRQISVAEARTIIQGVGGTVTSGTRDRATQERLYQRYLRGEGPLAARPGTSAHERGNAVDVVGASLADIRRGFREAGVTLRRAFYETNPRTGARHVHAEWGAGSSRERSAESDQSRAAAAARRDEAAEDLRRRNEENYNQAMAQVQEQLLAHRRSQVSDAAEQARLSLEEVNLERDRAVSLANANFATEKWTEAQRDQYIAAQYQLALTRRYGVERSEFIRIAAERRQLADADLELEQEVLRAEEGLLTSREALRASALRQLDLAERRERAQLEELAAGTDAVAAQRARNRLAELPALYGAQRAGVERDNESPRERYLRDLGDAANNAGDRMEEIAVSGFERLNDELAETISGFVKLGGVAGRVIDGIIEDLLRMAIQSQIIQPLASAFFGSGMLGGGGAGKLVGGGGFWGSAASGMMSIAGKREHGGPVRAGSAYIVGERRPELFVPDVSGTIIPHVPKVVIPQMGGQSGGERVIRVQLQTDDDMFTLRVAETAGVVVEHAAPGISARAKAETIDALRRRSLGR